MNQRVLPSLNLQFVSLAYLLSMPCESPLKSMAAMPLPKRSLPKKPLTSSNLLTFLKKQWSHVLPASLPKSCQRRSYLISKVSNLISNSPSLSKISMSTMHITFQRESFLIQSFQCCKQFFKNFPFWLPSFLNFQEFYGQPCISKNPLSKRTS